MSKYFLSLSLLLISAFAASNAAAVSPFSLGLGLQSLYLSSVERGFDEQDLDVMGAAVALQYHISDQVAVIGTSLLASKSFVGKSSKELSTTAHSIDVQLRTSLGLIRPYLLVGVGYIVTSPSVANEQMALRLGFGVEHPLTENLGLNLAYTLNEAGVKGGDGESSTLFGLSYRFP